MLLNIALGVAAISSASEREGAGYQLRQTVFAAFGLFMLFLTLLVDYKTLMTFAFPLYGLVVLVLTAMIPFAKLIAGTKSWIRLPHIQIQPSEILKVVLILMLAQLFAGTRRAFITRRTALAGSGLVFVPFILVALQPDLATAVCYLPILAAALILAGLTRKTLALIVIAAVLLGIVAWNFGLRDYQKKRVMTLLFPGQDPQGAGYHVMQSKIAIGAGGMFGKGFGKGSQSQLRFLPARHTDFVFSVIGEEFGFAGILAALGLYFLLLARLFQAVGQSRDRAGVYIVFMVVCLIAFQFLVNILMIIGALPIAGIPLPFLSYGGSSLLANVLAVGLVLNVKMRRFANV
ncbi:MAG: rod shape-determining protein RodA [Candidatus Aminicenantes bacterium]|nr:rod shape-determining protein RodA [Candidatus Aminicenantes bacterium]